MSKFNIDEWYKKIQETDDLDELNAMLRKCSPYKNKNIKEKPSWANMSVLNMREKYEKRLLMVSMISYMNRLAKDYGEKDSEERKIAQEFVNKCFRFNPEKHFEDFSAKVGEKAVQLSDEEAADIAEDLIPKDIEEKAQMVYATVRKLKNSSEYLVEAIKNDDLESAKPVAYRVHESIRDAVGTLGKVVNPRTFIMSQSLENLIVPGEIFHAFDRYYSFNFENLKKITESVYPERADIEFAVRYYQSFDTEKEAIEHRRKHQTDFDYDVYTIKNEGTTLLGPFRKNREKMDYYNSNNEVLQQIMDQQERDAKTGQEIMKNRVTRDKKRDIERFGDDPKKLEEYKQMTGIVDAFGGKNPGAMTSEEKRKLAEAREKLEVMDSNKNENIVPVHTQDEDGNLQTEYVTTDVTDDKTYAHTL